jgi:hypothetical protein
MYSIHNLNIDDIVDYIMKTNKIKNIPLQKYYTLKRFLATLKNDTFTFQKPSTWEDPFEDFISKLTNNYKKAYVQGLNITYDIYAMSTINKKNECDGMWKNFANTSGVLVHTSSKKIITSLVKYVLDKGCCANPNVHLNSLDIKRQLANSIRFKKIEYRGDVEIAKLFLKATNKEAVDYNSLSFDMLSIKRMEYEYENEYRFFLVADILDLTHTKFLSVGYFKETIEKIILSPKANDIRVHRLNTVLFKKYNINKNIVEKSNLYDIEHFKRVHNLS